MIKKLLLTLLLFYASNSLALSYSCPNTFSAVNTGNTMDMVRAACGDPTDISIQEQNQMVQMPIVEWIYNYVAAPILYKNTVSYLPILPLSLVILFQNDKVFHIEKNGVSATSGVLCSLTGLVNLGDSIGMVKLKCGQPNYVSSFMMPVNNSQTVIVWTYNSGPYKPQQLFNFVDNKLFSVINSNSLP